MVVYTRNTLQLVLRFTTAFKCPQRRLCGFQYGARTFEADVFSDCDFEPGDVVVCYVTGYEESTMGCCAHIVGHDGGSISVAGVFGILYAKEK